MKYPTTGHEVYVSLNLSNTMLTGIGKGTITREEVSVDYLKDLFSRHGVIVSAKPEQKQLLQLVPLLRRGIFSCHQHTEHGFASPVIWVMREAGGLLHGLKNFMVSVVSFSEDWNTLMY